MARDPTNFSHPNYRTPALMSYLSCTLNHRCLAQGWDERGI